MNVKYMDFFELKKKAPLCWFNKSSDLRASAGALWLSMDKEQPSVLVNALGLGTHFNVSVAVWPVYMMLCGLSLELLYKAISVAKGKTVANNHELIVLAELAGIKTDEQSQNVLSLLTESIYWDGKYPVPLDKKKDSFLAFNNLYNDVMYKKGQFHGFECSESSDALRWISFNNLWLDASEEFWANYNARFLGGEK